MIHAYYAPTFHYAWVIIRNPELKVRATYRQLEIHKYREQQLERAYYVW